MVDDPAESTHILLNTCGFIREAKEESIKAILSASAQYPGQTLMVMGCLVERYRDELREGIPEVDAWFGLAEADVQSKVRDAVLGERGVLPPEAVGRSVSGGAHAYLKISDGCDESCSFCAIPGIKGPYRSATTEDILREAEECLAEGARELILVGQDTTRWTNGGLTLSGLVDLLAADDRLRWIRLMYLQPARVDDSFLEFMASHKKLCPYLDLPFQHSHPEIVRHMGRRGDGETYLGLLGRARRLMPHVSVRSTFIVGFPGETEEHFAHLVSFVKKARFDYAGGFVYSPEEGTEARGLRPRVGRSVAGRRLNHLNDVLGETAEREHRGLIGREFEVMIDVIDRERRTGGTVAVGRTRGQAPDVDGVTYVEGRVPRGSAPGDLVAVKISSVVGCDLIGECRAS